MGRLVLVFLSLFLTFSGSLAARGSGYGPLIGIGLEGIGNRGLEFIDAAKTLRPFEGVSGGSVSTDAEGWPLGDARTVLFDLRPSYAWAPPEDDPDRFQIDLSGRYRLSFKGQGEVRTGDATVRNQSYDPGSDTTTADLYFPPGKGLLIVDFVNTRGGIRDLRVIRPGYDADISRIFTGPFLSALEPFSVLRFMDFTHTNNSNPPHPARTEWNQRKLPTDATQLSFGGKKDGAAWEYVIALGNESGKDVWINVPVSASDDYIRKLAELFRQNLRPGIRIYLEYSNEVWNPLFTQQPWNLSQAIQEVAQLTSPGLPPAIGRIMQARRVANRTVQIARIFEEVYGVGSLNDTLRPVLSWWAIYPDDYRDMLQFLNAKYGPPAQYLYGIAMAPYFNSAGSGADASPDQILDRLNQSIDGWRSTRQIFIGVASQFGIRALTYEGGPDSGENAVSGGAAENVANRIRAHRHPRMQDLVVKDMKDAWFDLGGDLFMYFTLSSAYSRWGMWGLTEDISRTDTPKFEAIRHLVGSQGSAAAPAIVFPQYADGQGAQTRLVLRNNGPGPDSGSIVFRASDGAKRREFPYRVEPWDVLDVSTAGSGSLESGVVEVVSELGAESRLEGSEVFRISDRLVSVPGTPAGRTHQVYVSVNSLENTGVAMYHPGGPGPAHLLLRLVREGRLVAETDLVLQPNQQHVGFVTEAGFFSDYFDGREGEDFQGTLNILSATVQPVHVIGLIQQRSDGALLAIAPGSAIASP